MDTVLEYLRYIGIDSIREPDIDFLRELQSNHLLTVPFENWDIHTGRKIELDTDKFIDKILRRNRGGFCYELNGAFAWLLERLGYKVSRLSARVEMQSGSFGPEFDHLTLLVDINGGYIVDVGFGASSLFPLPLSGEQISEPLSVFRISRTDDGIYMYQSFKENAWHTEYLFSLNDHPLSAFHAMCEYHQTSPDSPFPKGTLCTKATVDGRVSIRGMMLVESRKEGKTERHISEPERDQLLKDLFHINIQR